MIQETYNEAYDKGIADALSQIGDVLRALKTNELKGIVLDAREVVEACKERVEGLRLGD